MNRYSHTRLRLRVHALSRASTPAERILVALRRAFGGMLLSAVAMPVMPAIVGDYTARKITEMYTYTEYGGGDVVFRVDVPIAGCEGGFWLRSTDAGYKTNVAAVLMAYGNKSAVRVWAHNDQLWSGSGSPTCRLYSIGLA